MTAIDNTTFATVPQEHAAVPQKQEGPSRLTLIGQALCVVVPLAIWFMPVDIEPTSPSMASRSRCSWWWRG